MNFIYPFNCVIDQYLSSIGKHNSFTKKKRRINGLKKSAFLLVIFIVSVLTSCSTASQTLSPSQSVLNSSLPPASTPYPLPSPINSRTPSPTDVKPSYTPSPPTPTNTPVPSFSFVVNADMANHVGPGEFDTPQYFRGMVETIAQLPNIQFMISVGDTTPSASTRWTIDQYLGSDFLWFPVIGNHELDQVDLNYLRNYDYDPNGDTPPNIVNHGPPGCENTTFSFDYENTHFVILNEYCDLDNEIRTDGAIVDALYDWLAQDLQVNTLPHILVFGHEPAFPEPDVELGIVRHEEDSLDKYPITRDRFWALLKEDHVAAYFVGHTHSYSAVNIDGVWQIDAGHSMGAWTQSTPSTFIVMHVVGNQITYETYRTRLDNGQYELRDSGMIAQ